MSARDDIIRVAKSYIGVRGGSVAHRDLLHIFNSVKPYGYTANVNDPWCAEFVSACAIQAFGKKTAKNYFPLSAACSYIIKGAKSKNIWVENDAYIPKKGDWILSDWDDSGNGDNKNSPDHVEIVEKVIGDNIVVIGGNYSNRVKRRTIKVNAKYIRGFVTPKYNEINTGEKVALKSLDEIVKEVLSGEWGNGAIRKNALTAAGYDYQEVQNRVTQITKKTNKALKGDYGTGKDRVIKLGDDYEIVQWNINRIYKEKEGEKNK